MFWKSIFSRAAATEPTRRLARMSRRRMIGEALESRRLLATAGDLNADDVFKPDPATWDHGNDVDTNLNNSVQTHTGQVLINICELDKLPKNKFWTLSDGTTPLSDKKFNATTRKVNAADDDSAAFNAVLDFIWHRIDLYDNVYPGVDGYDDPSTDFAIYVPAGDYDLKTTVRDKHYEQASEIQMAHLRILGQGRKGTNATNLFASAADPNVYSGFVIDLFSRTADSSVMRSDAVNSRPGRNAYENFNLNVPAAVVEANVSGMQVSGANAFRMKNVSILGGVSSSRGVNDTTPITVGLTVRAPTSGVISNVTVDGFDEGIRLQGNQLVTPEITSVTLRKQHSAALVANGGQPTVENLLSQQSYTMADGAPEAILARDAAAVTVLGGNFQLAPGAATSPRGTSMQANGPRTTSDGTFSGSSITAFKVTVDGNYLYPMKYDAYAQADRDGNASDGLFGAVAAPTAALPANAGQSLTSDYDVFVRSAAGLLSNGGAVSYDSPGGLDFLGDAVAESTSITWLTVTGDASSSFAGTDNTFDAQELDALANTIDITYANKPVGIHFSNRLSVFKGTFNVPANVVAIDFNYGFVNNSIDVAGATPILRIAAGADADADGVADGVWLVVSNISRAFTPGGLAGKKILAQILGDATSNNESPRTVVFDDVSTAIAAIDDLTDADIPQIYLQDATGFLQSPLDPATQQPTAAPTTSAIYFARGINTEGPDKVAFGRIGSGAKLYVAGFKTEQDNVTFEVDADGELYVFGGGSSQESSSTSAFANPILRYSGATGARAFLTISTYRRRGSPTSGSPLRTKVVVRDGSMSPLMWDSEDANLGLPRRQIDKQKSYDYFVPYLALLDDSYLRCMNAIGVPAVGSPSAQAAVAPKTKDKPKRANAAVAIIG